MTVFSGPITTDGSMLDVTLMVTVPRRKALERNQMTVPTPVLAKMLIDTGASHSSIDQRFVSLLDLRPVGTIQMHTPSTGRVPVLVDEYDIAILIQGSAGQTHLIPITPVIGCDHTEQGIDGLFGRDALAGGLFAYNGLENRYTLAF